MSGAGGAKRPSGGDSPPGPPEKKSKKEEKTTTTLIEPIRIAGVSSTVSWWCLQNCFNQDAFVLQYDIVDRESTMNIFAKHYQQCLIFLALCVLFISAGGNGYEGHPVQE